jgi:hypothetical protein
MNRHICTLLVALVIAQFGGSVARSADITWINPEGGDWNAATNWDLDRVPCPSDDVIIVTNIVGPGEPGTVWLNTDAVINTLTFRCVGPLAILSITNSSATLELVNGGSATVCALNGNVQVDHGSFILTGVYAAGGNIVVGAGALVDLTGGGSTSWNEELTGSGPGEVLLSSGSFGDSKIAPNGLTLNFAPGLFWWTGGNLGFGGDLVTNVNTVTIWPTNAPSLQAEFYNEGLVILTNSGTFDMSYSMFVNTASGTFEFAGDGGYVSVGGNFENYGTIRKSSGTGTSVVSSFSSYGSTIEADSGELVLRQAGIIGGSFVVGAGALVDLTGGGNTLCDQELTGSGPGEVLLSSGTLSDYLPYPAAVTLNFAPGQFWWTGGRLFGGPAVITNLTTVIIWPTNAPTLQAPFYNAGLVTMTNSGALDIIGSEYGLGFINLASGTFEFVGDGGSVSGAYTNYGTLRKSSGTGTSTLTGLVNQGGIIEVDSGQLVLDGDFAQNGGALRIKFGGTGPGHFGQLIVSGNAAIGGPLYITLVTNVALEQGSQFQILSCASLTNTFSATNVPAGLLVSYKSDGVYLVVAGPPPVQILTPQSSGGHFNFSFQTVSNQSYTVRQNTNLTTSDWVFYTNFTGDGSMFQFTTSLSNAPDNFFRVTEP